MRVTLFTHLTPDEAAERLSAAIDTLYEESKPEWTLIARVRGERFALGCPFSAFTHRLGLRGFSAAAWLRGRFVATGTGTRLDCRCGLHPVLAGVGILAAGVLTFFDVWTAPSFPWLKAGLWAAGAALLTFYVLAVAAPAALWWLYRFEFVGFLREALDAELLEPEPKREMI
jgi:hypothetical protein